MRMIRARESRECLDSIFNVSMLGFDRSYLYGVHGGDRFWTLINISFNTATALPSLSLLVSVASNCVPVLVLFWDYEIICIKQVHIPLFYYSPSNTNEKCTNVQKRKWSGGENPSVPRFRVKGHAQPFPSLPPDQTSDFHKHVIGWWMHLVKTHTNREEIWNI